VLDRDALLGAVARLPSERRVVVAMRYWLDLDPPEIAAALGVPVGTVSSRLSRALSELRQLLEVEGR
jgi:RNA polymerase sigma factor (sigma-70 family)